MDSRIILKEAYKQVYEKEGKLLNTPIPLRRLLEIGYQIDKNGGDFQTETDCGFDCINVLRDIIDNLTNGMKS